jgi:hypothetical protein
MRMRKTLRHLDQLPVALVRTEIDRRAHSGRAHVVSFLDRAKQDLVKLVRVCQQLIVIDLHDKGNVVRVLASHYAQHSKRGRHRIAAAFHRELHDVFGVEVLRVFSEACARGVLDALVHGKNGNIAGAGKPPVREDALEVGEHSRIAVRLRVDAIDDVAARQVKAIFRNLGIAESQQAFRSLPQILLRRRTICIWHKNPSLPRSVDGQPLNQSTSIVVPLQNRSGMEWNAMRVGAAL